MLPPPMEDPGLARAAERVHELAQSLVRSAAAAHREVAALEGALGGPLGGPPLDAAAVVDLDSARLVAIELADAGGTRGEVAHHLRVSFGGLAPARLDGVLADVFG
jgi:hypothetical protein